MKKIIGGKRYNTETAKYIGEYDNGYGLDDFNYILEELYLKRTGEFFLHAKGHGLTKYAERYGNNAWGMGEHLVPLSIDEAKEWVEKHLDYDDYEKLFEIEDENNYLISVLVPVSIREKIEARAKEKDVSMSVVINDALKKYFEE